MKSGQRIGIAAALVLVAACSFAAYEHWHAPHGPSRDDVLSWTPSETSAEIFLDLNSLRQSPFLAELLRWAPQPAADPDYSQFVQATGFNYETDLNQVAISMRAGLLDVDGAAQEIDLTEKQLHELIDRLRSYAGVEVGG